MLLKEKRVIDYNEITDTVEKIKAYFSYTLNNVDFNLSDFINKIYNFGMCYNAYYNNDLAGTIMFYANDSVSKSAYISIIAVTEAYRGKKVSDFLLNICFRECIKLGMKKIKLQVRKDNVIAKNLYEKNDFKEIDSNDDTIYMLIDLQNKKVKYE